MWNKIKKFVADYRWLIIEIIGVILIIKCCY